MKFILAAALLMTSSISFAKLRVVTTVTDLVWAAKVIGGDKVEVQPFLTGYEDPHHIDAVPKYITMAANADVVCSAGLSLEIGWLPRVLQKSGNRQVQRGGKGFCELGTMVDAINQPKGRVDRSMGDLHPDGNPHFWLGPSFYLKASEVILNTYINVDAKNAEYYMKGYEKLTKKVNALLKENRASLNKAFKGKMPVAMEYHQEFAYFFNDYGLTSAGAIEELPGVPPSAARVVRAAMDAKNKKVSVVLAGLYAPKNILNRFAEISKLKVNVVSTSVLPTDKKWDTYIKSQKELIKIVINAGAK